MKDINKFTNELFNSSGLSVNPSHDIHDLCKEIKITVMLLRILTLIKWRA